MSGPATDAFLQELLAVVERIAQHGDAQAVAPLLALTAQTAGPPVLAQLAEAFARMVVQLEAREFQLEGTIADLLRVKQELELANYDPLTQLANRVIARDRLGQALSAARRREGQAGAVVGVLYLDLDRFKAVNDGMGHAAGDELLRQVAQRLRQTVRAADTVARLGGDEFLCVMPALDDLTAAQELAARLVVTLSTPFELAAGPAHIGTSIGIAGFPQHADTVDALVACADAALYQAKHAGRNGFRVAVPVASGPG
jgi:diguanylate cyclase (GGDEF)-like protein